MRIICLIIVRNIVLSKGLFIWAEVISVPARKHFDRSNNVVLFIWRNVFPLTGKVSRGDVDFVKCKQKVFPLSGKFVFIWDKNYLGHRDLACHQARPRLTGKLFVSYERKVTFHAIFVRRRDLACKLVEMFSREPR